MALTALGLGGILTFNSKRAVKEMKNSHMAFGQVDMAASKLDKTVSLTTDRFRMGMLTAKAAAKNFARVMSTQVVAAAIRMGAVVSRAAGKVIVGAFRMAGRAAKRFFMGMRAGMAGLGAMMGGIGSAIRSAGMGLLPTTLLLKKGISTAAGFEKEMSGVKAILKDIGENEMSMLTQKAKEMGIKSVFSAQQSAEAMQNLARAGFGANEVMGAIDSTIHAAAAEGMGLADAARLVANNVRAFGLEAKQADVVADTLALTSARTNTTMLELGESLKYSAPIARMMGMEIAETSATIGLLADSGLQGSTAGTALKNALLKLAAPTGKGAKALKRLGLTVQGTGGEFVGMESVLRQLQTGLNTVGGSVDRTAVAAKLFGLRGVALTNLLSRLDKGASGSALTFGELHKQLKNAKGSAEEMANIRLDNVIGQFTLLGSSIQAAFIETFEGVLGPIKDTIKGIIGDETSGLNGVLFVVQRLKKMTPEARAEFEKFGDADKGLTTIQQVALGIMDAIEGIKQGWNTLTTAVGDFTKWLNEKLGGEGVRNLTKIAIKFITIAGTLTPIVLILGLLAWVLKATLIPLIVSVGLAFKVALGPVGLLIIGIIALLRSMKEENEGFFDVIIRVWMMIASRLKSIWTNAIKPFIDGFGFAIEAIGGIFKEVFGIIAGILSWFVSDTEDATGKAGMFWKGFGLAASAVIGSIATVIKTLLFFVRETIDGIGILIDKTLELLGLSVSKKKMVATFHLETPLKAALKKSGFGQKGETLEGISSMGKARQRMWAAKASRSLTPQQLAKISPQSRREAGSEFIGMIKAAWKAKEDAELARYKDDKPIQVNSTLENKQTIEVNPTLCIDKKKVATAMARHQLEVMERTSSKKKSWQPRAALEFAAIDIS